MNERRAKKNVEMDNDQIVSLDKLKEYYSDQKNQIKKFPLAFKVAYLLMPEVQKLVSMASVD